MKLLELWHPDSPGIRVWVIRNWLQRLLYPKHFATISETIRYNYIYKMLRKE